MEASAKNQWGFLLIKEEENEPREQIIKKI